MGGRLLTQEEVIEELRAEGYEDVSTRTLTFWRSESLLPQLIRNGNEGCYREEVLDAIRLLCIKSRRKKAREETVAFVHLEAERILDVVRVEIVRLSGNLKIFYHSRSDGFLIRDLREEEVPYAFTSIN